MIDSAVATTDKKYSFTYPTTYIPWSFKDLYLMSKVTGEKQEVKAKGHGCLAYITDAIHHILIALNYKPADEICIDYTDNFSLQEEIRLSKEEAERAQKNFELGALLYVHLPLLLLGAAQIPIDTNITTKIISPTRIFKTNTHGKTYIQPVLQGEYEWTPAMRHDDPRQYLFSVTIKVPNYVLKHSGLLWLAAGLLREYIGAALPPVNITSSSNISLSEYLFEKFKDRESEIQSIVKGGNLTAALGLWKEFKEVFLSVVRIPLASGTICWSQFSIQRFEQLIREGGAFAIKTPLHTVWGMDALRFSPHAGTCVGWEKLLNTKYTPKVPKVKNVCLLTAAAKIVKQEMGKYNHGSTIERTTEHSVA